MELTILMPCLNEHETIAHCVAEANRFLSTQGVVGEVLVADNGSGDGSAKIAAEAGARVIHVSQKGYGNALIEGIREARGEYVIMGDADASYDLFDLLPMLEKLREGHQLVMGNRFTGGIKKGAMPFLHRYLGNPVLSLIGRLFFRVPVGDFHCGLRGFSRPAILSLGLRCPGMEFASEMLVKARLRNLSIAEIPTILSPDGRSRPSHLRTWRDGWRHLRFLLLSSPDWLFLYPGLLLLSVGTLGSTVIAAGPVSVGRLIFDVHTLMYTSLMILTGFQMVGFCVFSTVYSLRAGLLFEYSWLMRRLVRIFSLERGIAAGLAFLAAGVLLSALALGQWGDSGFGTLDPTRTLRLVIPGVVLFTFGFQLILYSFYLSLLGVDPPAERETDRGR